MAETERLTYVALCGRLGYGDPPESLEAALEHDPAFIGVDAGSTDPGPYYLGSGKPFVSDAQVRRDLLPALEAAVARGIPLIIGSAGGSGAAPHVDHFTAMLEDVASQRGLSFDLAVVYTDADSAMVEEALAEGRVEPCGLGPELTPAALHRVRNPVAQVGTEPIIEALAGGADVVVCGRCCDTAIFAALPIMNGFDPGLVLHAAKIAECGTLSARPEGANDCLLCTLHSDSFEVVPANPERACTPRSVAAHSLYEQPDPLRFVEPEGIVDLSETDIQATDERTVRVSGTRLRESGQPTVKLEGAELAGFRSIALAGIADPRIIENIDVIQERVRATVAGRTGSASDTYEISFRRYGLDAVSWAPLGEAAVPGFALDLSAADLDGDGTDDLTALCADRENSVRCRVTPVLVRGRRHEALPSLLTGLRAFRALAADLSGDGRAELFAANLDSHDVSAWMDAAGEGAPRYRSLPEIGAGVGCIALAAPDLDGDGDLDLLVVDSANDGVSVILNDAPR